MISFTIDGIEAKAAARGRLGKSGAFYSPSSKKEKSLAWLMRSKTYARIEGKFYLSMELGFARLPKGDIDNYAKYIMDALQKSGIINNDKDCMELYCKIVVKYPYIKINLKEM